METSEFEGYIQEIYLNLCYSSISFCFMMLRIFLFFIIILYENAHEIKIIFLCFALFYARNKWMCSMHVSIYTNTRINTKYCSIQQWLLLLSLYSRYLYMMENIIMYFAYTHFMGMPMSVEMGATRHMTVFPYFVQLRTVIPCEENVYATHTYTQRIHFPLCISCKLINS